MRWLKHIFSKMAGICLLGLFASRMALAQNPYKYGNSPTQLHLALWYDADTGITTSGSVVTNWANKDSNWYNLSNLNGIGSCGQTRPQYISNSLNGHPTLQFGQNSHLLWESVASQDFKSISQIALYTVIKATRNGIVFHHSKGAYALHYATDHSRWGGRNQYSKLVYTSPMSSPYEIRTFIVSPLLWPNIYNTYEDYTNGRLTSYRIYPYYHYLSSVTDTLLLGNRWVHSCNVWGFAGNLAEIMAYKDNHKFNTTNRAKVTTYLSLKYGISQDTTGENLLYLNSDSTDLWPYDTTIAGSQFENYKTRITGIFRDQAFNSTGYIKSRNQSADVVSIALTDNGGTFSSPNEFNKDGQAVLWGDNDSVLTFNETTDVPANFTRIARIWKVKETLNGGTIGNVTIEFDFSTIPSLSGISNASQILCLVDTDGDGSFADETGIVPTTWDSGTEIGQFTADFNDGQLFSFAINNLALPVTWLHYEALAKAGNIEIVWSCAAERNNDHFAIQKLSEFGDWAKIGQVRGAGNSSETTHYKFTDQSPLNGPNYYRLVQVDFQGTESYTPIFLAQCPDCGQTTLELASANPNYDGWIKVEIGQSVLPTEISVFNTLGVPVYHHSVFEGSHHINLGHLPKGMYVITLRQGNQLKSDRFIFQ